MVILTTHANFPWYVTQAVLAVFIGEQRDYKIAKKNVSRGCLFEYPRGFRAPLVDPRENWRLRTQTTRARHTSHKNRFSTDLLKLKVCRRAVIKFAHSRHYEVAGM